MAIHFHRRGHGFEKGETVQVVAVENDSLKVQRADGSEIFFPLGQGSALFDVGEKRKLKVAAGDKLLLQANAVAVRKHFVNGELVEVKRHSRRFHHLLTDGRMIPADYRTFTHGYAVTSHAAQGKTVDEVLVVASSRSLPAINQEQFYVSISRGRERCQILPMTATCFVRTSPDSSARLAAIEAMPQRDFLQTILQRGNRFLKRFRQRLAQSISIETTERSSHEIKPTEHQRQSTRHISV